MHMQNKIAQFHEIVLMLLRCHLEKKIYKKKIHE
jgi:hypothetical protein